ncbi:response regulator transcription factor [uncultured Limnohabitans sp.]|uniref:response regulator transcription factor n=1 Tax=uncultured Limnohabitans sp. TaxID=768543 RepID=UPI002601D9AC|nr:response regulator transcription factor [uncultured Limnohabitans sp.]
MNTLAPHILLVEDTPDIALWLGSALRQGGMTVHFATDGVAADQCLQPGHRFDAVLLDLQLPGLDGLSVLQALRARGDAVPVLVLTARASVPDRVLGLNMGADDYLPKPFDLSELEARLQVLLRRHGRTKPATLRWGALEMDADTDAVQLHGQVLALTQREAAALRVLMASPQRTVSKEQLHAQVFADEAAGLDAVEVLIYRLRKKLDAAHEQTSQTPDVAITTFRGMGYLLTAPSARP